MLTLLQNGRYPIYEELSFRKIPERKQPYRVISVVGSYLKFSSLKSSICPSSMITGELEKAWENLKNCGNRMSYSFLVEPDGFLEGKSISIGSLLSLRNVQLSIQTAQASKLAISIVLNFGKFCFCNKI